MANLRIQWVLPTVRQSGLPLPVEEIANVRIDLSADGGQSYGEIGVYAPNILETIVQDLEPGEWFVRGTVVDVQNRQSTPVSSSIVIADDSPPGGLTLILDLA